MIYRRSSFCRVTEGLDPIIVDIGRRWSTPQTLQRLITMLKYTDMWPTTHNRRLFSRDVFLLPNQAASSDQLWLWHVTKRRRSLQQAKYLTLPLPPHGPTSLSAWHIYWGTRFRWRVTNGSVTRCVDSNCQGATLTCYRNEFMSSISSMSMCFEDYCCDITILRVTRQCFLIFGWMALWIQHSETLSAAAYFLIRCWQMYKMITK